MRPYIAVLLLLCLLGTGVPPAHAQQKVSREAMLWPELQLYYVFRSDSFLFFRNHYRHVLDNDFNQLRRHGFLQYLERVQFRLGYEHAINASWRAGISQTYALERSRTIWFHEVYASHTAAIGQYRFSQRASFEHLVHRPRNDNGRLRLRLDLERSFPIGQLRLRPRVNYELFFYTYYQAPTNAGRENRMVDRSRLRLDCQLNVSEKVAVTPFFLRQTDFFVVEPGFDADNAIIRPGGKQNHVTPVWGLEFRFYAFAGGKPAP